jgi:hypothetical protein
LIVFVPPVPSPVIILGGGGGYAQGPYAQRWTLPEWWQALWGRRLPKLREATTLEEAVAETDEELLDLLMGL